MACLSPFKKFVEDLFEAYDASGPVLDLSTFISNNATGSVFGIYPVPPYCEPSCEAIDDICGNIYFLGNASMFISLATFKGWTTNPASAPCCYNFMGTFSTSLLIKSEMCWSSIPRCCKDLDTCFKTFETAVPEGSYLELMSNGVVEYGTIDDDDNICFLKTYLEDRYNDPVKVSTYISQILSVGLVFTYDSINNYVYVFTVANYDSLWCSTKL
jgi:hypothetical protein